jgi:hypothetical protein
LAGFWVDTVVMVADGGRAMSDLAVLRNQGELFGSVASDRLVRTLHRLTTWSYQSPMAFSSSTCRTTWISKVMSPLQSPCPYWRVRAINGVVVGG